MHERRLRLAAQPLVTPSDFVLESLVRPVGGFALSSVIVEPLGVPLGVQFFGTYRLSRYIGAHYAGSVPADISEPYIQNVTRSPASASLAAGVVPTV